MMEASIKHQDKYFIGVNTDPVPENILLPFLEKIRLISRKCEVTLIRSGDIDNNCLAIKSFAAKYINFKFILIPREQQQLPNSSHARFSNTVFQLADYFINSGLPYLLLLDNVVHPPLNLLKKFDRAISYLENIDSKWGIVGGLYHRGLNINTNADNHTSHVLSGCYVYKKKVIEHWPLYHEFTCYDGHRLIEQSKKPNRIKPVIVKG